MVVLILLFLGALGWLEYRAVRIVHRRSLEAARVTPAPDLTPSIEDVVARTAAEITTVLDVRACWFEPFPFDVLLPRIEAGRIVLPTPEPGVVPCSHAGVELPVRANGLTLGRFVVVPPQPSVGVILHRPRATARWRSRPERARSSRPRCSTARPHACAVPTA